jgi:hypothetical protein
MIGPLPTDSGGTDSAEQEHWHQFSERCASISLKTLTVAEPDFRANDRDWCHVDDFWTADVRGLYTMSSAEVRKPEVVRCAPIEYWDGIGTWHGNLWMLYRMCAAAQPREADTIKLIELSIESADSPEK